MDNFKFTPDKWLVKWANHFADNHKAYDCGVWCITGSGKYAIYFTPIPNTTTARINHTTNQVEVNYNLIGKDDLFTREYVFYLVLWCFCYLEFRKTEVVPKYDNTSVLFDVDRMTLEYYVTTGKSLKLLYIGLKRQFEIRDTDLNRRRYKEIKKQK